MQPALLPVGVTTLCAGCWVHDVRAHNGLSTDFLDKVKSMGELMPIVLKQR